MRLLHVVPSYLPAVRYGGPIYSVHGLCRGLSKLGHDVHVFTTNVDGPRDSNVPLGRPVYVEGVQVWYFPSRRLRRFYWSPAMNEALRTEMKRFDLVHLHSVFLAPTLMAARAARRTKTPYILSPRGMLVRDLIHRKSRWLKTACILMFERRNVEQAAAVHVTSEVEADELAHLGLRSRRIVTCPNGVDLPSSIEGESVPDAPVSSFHARAFILFVGRVNWKKGLDRLIQALVHVPHMDLVIAGNDEEDYQPALESIAHQVGVTDRVHFVGPTYGAAKWSLLRAARVLVLPSYSENFGNVVLEAMAVGCPVVLTPEVGAAEIVRSSGAGLVVNGDPKTLGNGIAEILSDETRRQSMTKAGLNCIAQHYSWDRIAKRMEAIYDEVLSTQSGMAPA